MSDTSAMDGYVHIQSRMIAIAISIIKTWWYPRKGIRRWMPTANRTLGMMVETVYRLSGNILCFSCKLLFVVSDRWVAGAPTAKRPGVNVGVECERSSARG